MVSLKCPFCKSSSEGGYCKHLLAILDLSFNDVQEGKARGVFEEWISDKQDADDTVFMEFKSGLEAVADFAQSISEDSSAGFSSSEMCYWSKEPDVACKQLKHKLGNQVI